MLEWNYSYATFKCVSVSDYERNQLGYIQNILHFRISQMRYSKANAVTEQMEKQMFCLVNVFIFTSL